MVHYELLKGQGVLVLTPQEPLDKDDFVRIAQEVDVYLAEQGRLKGVLVLAKSFPGWADFDAFLAHMQFLDEHEKKIERVAVVTDSPFLDRLPAIAEHFVAADIKHFPLDEEATALQWVEAA